MLLQYFILVLCSTAFTFIVTKYPWTFYNFCCCFYYAFMDKVNYLWFKIKHLLLLVSYFFCWKNWFWLVKGFGQWFLQISWRKNKSRIKIWGVSISIEEYRLQIWIFFSELCLISIWVSLNKTSFSNDRSMSFLLMIEACLFYEASTLPRFAHRITFDCTLLCITIQASSNKS